LKFRIGIVFLSQQKSIRNVFSGAVVGIHLNERESDSGFIIYSQVANLKEELTKCFSQVFPVDDEADMVPADGVVQQANLHQAEPGQAKMQSELSNLDECENKRLESIFNILEKKNCIEKVHKVMIQSTINYIAELEKTEWSEEIATQLEMLLSCGAIENSTVFFLAS